ncbi:MAG TPA: RNA polymerase sigma factor [Candidatus Angelobacter sp.]|jgi:RNA polymerase sigma-70 factor (ECF subfamily)|nr:RNA polymerase sigma factor [Candidatus Angelobacter sp.]
MDQTDLRDELERLHSASFGWALWCCDHRREDAEEVLQTAYLKVLEGAARFNGRSSLRTWFFAVVRRTAWEQRRLRWVRELLLARWLWQPALVARGEPDEALRSSEQSHALRHALAALPTRQREVLHLVFYQELTIEEAAKVLSISLGTARTHFERGKARLRTLLEQEARR